MTEDLDGVTQFSDLFEHDNPPTFVSTPPENVAIQPTMSKYFNALPSKRVPWTNDSRDAANTTIACCMCYKTCCGNFLTGLRPSKKISPYLEQLRYRVGSQRVPMLHVRNADEKSASGTAHLYRVNITAVVRRVQKGRLTLPNFTFSYAATQKAEDAAAIRAAMPDILLQQDFRHASLDDLNSQDGLLSAAFDLFALAMAPSVHATTFSSSFSGVVSCMRGLRDYMPATQIGSHLRGGRQLQMAAPRCA